MEATANGIIKIISPSDVSYYTSGDVQKLLGISRTKAYTMIRELREELVKKGVMTSVYPAGKIPKKYFDQRCLIE